MAPSRPFLPVVSENIKLDDGLSGQLILRQMHPSGGGVCRPRIAQSCRLAVARLRTCRLFLTR